MQLTNRQEWLWFNVEDVSNIVPMDGSTYVRTKLIKKRDDVGMRG